MKFTKMHGLGNDFILIDAFHQPVPDASALVARLCDRHFGIGADGLILALPSAVADARMGYYNRDGSAAQMCGNGIRCLARFLHDKGLCRKSRMSIETGAGVLPIELQTGDGCVQSVTVDMGIPIFDPDRIPVQAESNRICIEMENRKMPFYCVSMGNPHAVCFDYWPDDAAFHRLGAAIERHPLFPERVNVEFCRLDGMGGVDVKVWERGDGPTLACGTGACAVVAAGVQLGLLQRQAEVRLPGGALAICWRDDDHIQMRGPATIVFEGCVE